MYWIEKHRNLANIGEELSYKDIKNIADCISELESTPLQNSLLQLLHRMSEVAILTDSEIRSIGDRWSIFKANADVLLRDRIEDITGVTPPDLLIKRIAKVLSGDAFQISRKRNKQGDYFHGVLMRIERSSPTHELRCENCGYHFRAKDIGKDKLKKVCKTNLKLAKYLYPGRTEDNMKPSQYSIGSNASPTDLELDHIIPEELLGWTDESNLAILCQFCNRGKLAHELPLEQLSSFVVAGLADYPLGRPSNRLHNTVVSATLSAQGGVCHRCEASKLEKEMTVIKITRVGEHTNSFAPWNLMTTCYDCYNASNNFSSS